MSEVASPSQAQKWFGFSVWAIIVTAVSAYLFATGLGMLSLASTIANVLGGALSISALYVFIAGIHFGIRKSLVTPTKES